MDISQTRGKPNLGWTYPGRKEVSCNGAATLGYNTGVAESSRWREAQTFLNYRSEVYQFLKARVSHLVFAFERSANFGRNFVPGIRILDEVIGYPYQECARGFATCKRLGSQNTGGHCAGTHTCNNKNSKGRVNLVAAHSFLVVVALHVVHKIETVCLRVKTLLHSLLSTAEDLPSKLLYALRQCIFQRFFQSREVAT